MSQLAIRNAVALPQPLYRSFTYVRFEDDSEGNKIPKYEHIELFASFEFKPNAVNPFVFNFSVFDNKGKLIDSGYLKDSDGNPITAQYTMSANLEITENIPKKGLKVKSNSRLWTDEERSIEIKNVKALLDHLLWDLVEDDTLLLQENNICYDYRIMLLAVIVHERDLTTALNEDESLATQWESFEEQRKLDVVKRTVELIENKMSNGKKYLKESWLGLLQQKIQNQLEPAKQ